MSLYFVAIICVFLFLYGFFPVSEVPSNVEIEPPTHINNITLNKEKIYKSPYNKTVIIVIDALRVDFVNTRDMPSTSRLVERTGCFSNVKVEAPTVTLPRIKALTAGNVPQFIDLVLNLGTTEILKDSIIHSAHRSGKKVVFYGDDTWLRLFPDKFHRYEGTTSFFVRDFTEVDHNVTRNVRLELKKIDWDIMILHYLGLDHIGHVYGPFSSLVHQKLHEMDAIVHEIHDMTKQNKNTLLVVTGDHGMRDSGGHGGSSYSETNVPFLIIGHPCENSSFPQIDIPVNLAVLLGIRIPSTTIGTLQKKLLPFDLEKYLYMLHYNALLLRQKSSLGQDHFELASIYHENYLKNSDRASALLAIELYENCSEIISHSLIKTSTEQNLSCMIFALVILFSVLSIIILQITAANKIPAKINSVINVAILFFILSCSLPFHYVLVVVVICTILVLNWQSLKSKGTVIWNDILRFFDLQPNILLRQAVTPKQKISIQSPSTVLLILGSIFQPLTFMSSSFVEEEHQYWYFFYNVFIIFCIIHLMRRKYLQDIFCLLCLLVTFRILRRINSTGDMWANQPDISDWLLRDENFYLHQTFFVLGLLLVFLAQLILLRDARINMHVANFVILSLIHLYKNNDSNVLLGRILWFFILCHFIFLGTSRIITWILISCLMLKPYNTVLVSYCIFSSLLVSKHMESIVDIVLFHSWLGNVLFFAQGHSNSFASVDISIGYIGLGNYNSILVIAQVLIHTYVFPVLCHILIFKKMKAYDRVIWNILFSHRLYTYFVVCIVTLIFRNHLFIWSVFAPKLFIESIHIAFLIVEICYYYISDMISSFKVDLFTKRKS